MSLTITSQDLLNLARNDLCIVGCVAVGSITACCTNRVLHDLFQVRVASKKSYTINTYTILAATVMVSAISLAPYTLLVSFTTHKVIELAAVNLIASSCLSLATRRIVYIPCAEGALLGLLGSWALIPLGMTSGLIGVAVANRIMLNNQDQHLSRAYRNYVQGVLGRIHSRMAFATDGEM